MERSKLIKGAVVTLVAGALLLPLILPFLGSNSTPPQSISRLSNSLPEKTDPADGKSPNVSSEAGAGRPDSGEDSAGSPVSRTEIRAAAIDDGSALQLKRQNFETWLRFQQRLSSSDQIEPASNDEARKSAAEQRIQKKVAGILLAAPKKPE